MTTNVETITDDDLKKMRKAHSRFADEDEVSWLDAEKHEASKRPASGGSTSAAKMAKTD